MAHNYVEKRNGKYLLVDPSKKVMVEDSDLEKFVYKILDLKKKGNLGGGVYTGVPTETDDEYLSREEHDKFYKLYLIEKDN